MKQDTFPHDVEDVVLTLCEDVGTPRAVTIAMMVKYREWDQLASLRCDPMVYTNPYRYKMDSIVTDFLRKCENLPTKVDREQAAVDTFWSSEHKCARTNLRLQPFLDGSYPIEDEPVFSFIGEVRKIVADILGPCPDIVEGRFGPGSTYSDIGPYNTVPDKMSECPTLTSGAIPFLFQWCGTQWASACLSTHSYEMSSKGSVMGCRETALSAQRDPAFIQGNRFTTVPKDATKDRGIAIEPSINLFYQLGYGEVLKRRLRRAGLNLLIAQETHRLVACEASIRGHFATLDLSNASDTVSNSLVKLLLPSRWYEVLSALRSPKTLVAKTHLRTCKTQIREDNWVVLEKFSSMGNGFTFELETLLFAALSKACLDSQSLPSGLGEDLFVFGDDIIIPTDSVRRVKAVLQYFGFSINETKSFVSGPFRESCGGDYFLGVNVRPYHLKEFPFEPQHYIAMANGVRRVGSKDPYPDDMYEFVRRTWFRVLDLLPSEVKACRGPRVLGDIVIHDQLECWSTRWRNSVRYVRCYRPASFRKVGWPNWRPDVILASATYGVGDGAKPRKRTSYVPSSLSKSLERARSDGPEAVDSGGVIPRGAVSGHKLAWVPFS